MPIYEYRCGECGHCFERIQGVADQDPEIVCPRCGKAKAERMMSTFSCGGGEKGIETGGSSGGCGPGGGRFT
jgi:putative FmdB family regulatory protein